MNWQVNGVVGRAELPAKPASDRNRGLRCTLSPPYMAMLVALCGVTPLQAQPERPKAPVTELSVSPAHAPVPALRWKLLPDLRDTTPGNAAQLYYRAFSPEWMTNLRTQKMAEDLDRAANMPLDELRDWVRRDGSAIGWVRNSHMLKEVDRAARRQYCDWDLVDRTREEGVMLLLPDVQSFREFARMLSVRARLEIADGNFVAADRTLQTGLSLGRHVSEAPTLIQSLVGTAISAVMLRQIEEWIRTPDSPNLYWALTNLPTPFIDLRKPLQGERLMVDNMLPGFREALTDPKAPPLAPVQLKDMMLKLRMMAEGQPVPAIEMFWVMKMYPAAKEFLRLQGWSDNRIESIPAMQAVLLFEVATYDRFYDEHLKWHGVPVPQARAGMAQSERALKEHLAERGGVGLTLTGILLPSMMRVYEASGRIDRRIAALRVVEAVRLYAADNGKLPVALADITAVPVPDDPQTGKPFAYTSDGKKATLIAAPDRGPATVANSLQYDIVLRK